MNGGIRLIYSRSQQTQTSKCNQTFEIPFDQRNTFFSSLTSLSLCIFFHLLARRNIAINLIFERFMIHASRKFRFERKRLVDHVTKSSRKSDVLSVLAFDCLMKQNTMGKHSNGNCHDTWLTNGWMNPKWQRQKMFPVTLRKKFGVRTFSYINITMSFHFPSTLYPSQFKFPVCSVRAFKFV